MSLCYIQLDFFCVSVDTQFYSVRKDPIFDAATNNPTALSLKYALADGSNSYSIYRTVKFALLSFYESLSSFANEAIRNDVYFREDGTSVSWDF